MDLSGGAGADRVIEATGNPPTVTEAINIARTRGNVTLAGSHLATTEISSNKIIGYESTLHHCTTEEDFPRAISLLDKLEVEPIITHRLSLDVAERASNYYLQKKEQKSRVFGLCKRRGSRNIKASRHFVTGLCFRYNGKVVSEEEPHPTIGMISANLHPEITLPIPLSTTSA